MLQVAVIWRGQIIGYQLLRRRRKITVGSQQAGDLHHAADRRASNASCCSRPRATATCCASRPSCKGDLRAWAAPRPSVADVASQRGRSGARRSRQADLRRRQRPAHRDPLGRPARRARPPARRRPRDGPDMVGTSIVLGLLAAHPGRSCGRRRRPGRRWRSAPSASRRSRRRRRSSSRRSRSRSAKRRRPRRRPRRKKAR